MPGYVSCEANNCIHRGRDEELYLLCMASVIEMCEQGGAFVCSSYKDYHELEDYQESFFKAVKTKQGRTGRLHCKGKKIEINGHVFYTDDHPNDVKSGFASLTHGPSGLYAGTMMSVKDRWTDVEKQMHQLKYTPVEKLPIAVRCEPAKGSDGVIHTYALVE